MKRPLGLLLAALFFFSCWGASIAPAQADAPDYRFGVIDAFDAPWAASDLGAGWTRVTFRWNEIQPDGPDQWIMPISDDQLNLELAQGRQVIGLVTNTPGWATDHGRGIGVPQGIYNGHNDPNNLWAVFLKSLVTRYAGRIDHWIIWNEPDIWESYHQSWGGSVEDFVQLMRVSYAVVKENNPNGVVHLAAVTHHWDADYGRELFMRRLLQVIVADGNAAGNNYYFDAVTLHIYFQSENVYELTVFYRNLVNEYVGYKPLWIVETNAAPSQDPAWPVSEPRFKVSLDDQAAFIVQALALGIAAGAERIAVYKTIDTERDVQANPEPFGLVRMDGTRRPAFTAYQVATTYMAGFRSGRWVQRDEASVVVIDRGSQTTTVAWSRSPAPQTVNIAAQTTSALLVDMGGRARLVYPDRGYYTLSLPGCAYEGVCLIGGAPLLLVEDSAGQSDAPPPPPAPTLPPVDVGFVPTATPAPTYTPTPSPTPTPTPTSTPSPTPTPSPTSTPSPTTVPSPTPVPTLTPTPSPTPVEQPLRLPFELLGLLLGGLAFIAGVLRKR